MTSSLRGHVNLRVEAPHISNHLAMFGGHQSSANEYIKYLICHVTSQNHVIEGSCNFMSGSSLLYVTTRPSLLGVGSVVVKIWF